MSKTINFNDFDVVVVEEVNEITKTVAYKHYEDYVKDTYPVEAVRVETVDD
ncbi:MAG: hypothetical protein GY861_10905 [bacterium]|nr:hypothetical protein [bacterium]